ncbi:type II toxin-antitoxin system prevent-host-death family antitoxin [Roseomonas aeriglobus]|jgi:prevent-host-death family protein|nr:type II toxin-antitoxin system prevent-host-death family antitoxin [Roseomonas aeriglobus]
MKHVNLADAKARFSELVHEAVAGETVVITRHGKQVAKLVQDAPEKVKVDVAALRKAAKSIPYQTESAADLVRRMRDSGF